MRILLLSVLLSGFYCHSQDLSFDKPLSSTNPIKNFYAQVFNTKNNPINGLSSWQINFYRNENGTWSAPKYTFRVFMSKDSIISTDDIVVYEIENNMNCSKGCFGHSTSGVIFDISCNNYSPSGSYYYIVKLDADNAINEVNETNNVGYIQFNYIEQTCGKVSALLQNTKSNYTQGELIPVNQISFSNSSSDNFSLNNQLELYLSTDPNFDNSDYKLSSSSFFSLQDPNNLDCNLQDIFMQIPSYSSYSSNLFTVCNNQTFRIPYNIPNGNYYVLLRSLMNNTFIVNNIFVGTTVTEIENVENVSSLIKVKKIIDLTGKELAIESAEGQMVIVLFENNTRKLTKFYKENYINGL